MEKQMDRVFYFNNGKKNPPIYGIKDGRYFFLRLDKTWEIRWTLEDICMEEEDKLVEIPERSEL